MSWHHVKTLAWQEPLALAAQFAGEDLALLYSGLRERFTGQTSYLFITPIETVSGADWQSLPRLSENASALSMNANNPSPNANNLPLWVGYLGYEMGDDVPASPAASINLPNFRLVRYAHLYRFDHTQRVVDVFAWGNGTALPNAQSSFPRGRESFLLTENTSLQKANKIPACAGMTEDKFALTHLTSNLTRAEYESIVTATVERIHAGDFYQANITRKFCGTFNAPPDSWALFTKLTTASPAPYSAYIRHGTTAILSSSPECFLSVDATGAITTRPIKGSARRGATQAEDEAIQHALRTSEKNHAENLMITDLMRNDLARVSIPETVRVVEQSALYSYATIHHLISTIHAQKREGISAYDIVRACFPPGSMTGAPKIAAMRWCAAQERVARGVYSGAIGWFGAGGTCDLSVTIRTLILDGARFEFQVGGGIVADSTPEDEWRETLTKARGILTALGLSEADLEKL